jgi:hypothetical protein
MVLECDADEIMASERGAKSAYYCNPQDIATEDSPPWNQLERMKKDANEVAMYSVPDDVFPVVTVSSGSTVDAPTVYRDEEEDNNGEDEAKRDEQRVEAATPRTLDGVTQVPFFEESSIDDDKALEGNPSPPATLEASSSSFSEYDSFAQASSGYLFPIKSWTQSEATAVAATSTTISVASSSESKHNNEGQEHTVENFNLFLELSSMTVNSFDHAGVMGYHGHLSSNDKDAQKDMMGTEEEDEEARSEKDIASGGLWPERLLRTPEMADAPSGILLVFDRMLDCIDPGGTRPEAASPTRDEEHVCGYETDQSSAWSIPMGRSWILREFEDLSTTCSSTIHDECSLAGSGILPIWGASRPPEAVEWLDESLDCIFPCWKEPPAVDEATLVKLPPPSIRDLANAVEAGRKRKWASEDVTKVAHDNKLELKLEEEEGEDRESDTEAFGEPVRSNSSGDDDHLEDTPFDFPPTEFPPSIWKKQESITAEAEAVDYDVDNASGSSLSELFEELGFGTPFDEKDDELQRILDRTSATEDTSTLSYSDGTI